MNSPTTKSPQIINTLKGLLTKALCLLATTTVSANVSQVNSAPTTDSLALFSQPASPG